jgi:hypothetical protein
VHVISYVVHDVDHCADHQDRRRQDRHHRGRRQERLRVEDHQGHLRRQDHQDEDQNQDVDHQGHLYEDHQGHLCVDHQGQYADHQGHLCEDHQDQYVDHQGQVENQAQDGNLRLCGLEVHYLEQLFDLEEEELDDQKETLGQEEAEWGGHLARLWCEAAYLGEAQMEVDRLVVLDALWAAD